MDQDIMCILNKTNLVDLVVTNKFNLEEFICLWGFGVLGFWGFL